MLLPSLLATLPTDKMPTIPGEGALGAAGLASMPTVPSEFICTPEYIHAETLRKPMCLTILANRPLPAAAGECSGDSESFKELVRSLWLLLGGGAC